MLATGWVASDGVNVVLAAGRCTVNGLLCATFCVCMLRAGQCAGVVVSMMRERFCCAGSGGRDSGETVRFTLPHRQGGMAPAARLLANWSTTQLDS